MKCQTIHKVPLDNGKTRLIVLLEDGKSVTIATGESADPDFCETELNSFELADAVALARRILAGNARSLTNPDAMRILAASLIIVTGDE